MKLLAQGRSGVLRGQASIEISTDMRRKWVDSLGSLEEGTLLSMGLESHVMGLEESEVATTVSRQRKWIAQYYCHRE